MSRGTPGRLLGLVAVSSVTSVALAVVFRPRRSAAPVEPIPAVAPKAGTAPLASGPGEGAQPMESAAAVDTTALDRAVVVGLDSTLHGTLEAYDFLRAWTLKDPARVIETMKRYRIKYAAWLEAKVADGSISRERAKASQDILNGLAVGNQVEGYLAQGVNVANQLLSAIGDSIPALGQGIKAAYQIVQLFVQGAAEAAKQGRSLWSWDAGSGAMSGGGPIFSGFRDGAFYFWEIPVWSFTVAMWVTEFTIAGASAGWQPAIQGFKKLATAKPFGYAVPLIRIENDGSYTYRFNLVTGGDVSDAAIARQEVREVTVWNPLDINPTGPRGFDPANPWSWKQPGQKLSRLDYVIPGAPPP